MTDRNVTEFLYGGRISACVAVICTEAAHAGTRQAYLDAVQQLRGVKRLLHWTGGDSIAASNFIERHCAALQAAAAEAS